MIHMGDVINGVLLLSRIRSGLSSCSGVIGDDAMMQRTDQAEIQAEMGKSSSFLTQSPGRAVAASRSAAKFGMAPRVKAGVG